MKKNLTTITALLMVLFAFSCAKQTESIKIGVSGPYSGDLASYGIPTREAVELFLENNPTVLGQPITLLVEDDQGKEETAANAAAKLASEGAVAVVGHITTGGTRAALGVYNEDSIISISPSSTATELTLGGKNPYFFRTIAHDDIQAQISSEFLVNTLGVKRVAILHDQGAYGKGYASAVKANLEAAGVEVVLFDGIEVGAPDYSAVLTRLVSENPDVFVFGGYHPEATKLISQLHARGSDIPMVGTDSLKDQQFIITAGADAEGVYTTGSSDITNLDSYKAVRELYLAKYNQEPGAFFYNAYAAIQVIAKAIEIAGSTESDLMVEAIKGNTFDTALGSISFDDNGDIEGFGFSVYRIENGSFITIE